MIYLDEFPNLQAVGFETTSDPSELYNCIAWAAGFDNGIWDPDEDDYWPPTVPRDHTIEAILAAFAHLGFDKVNLDDSHAPGIQKVAIYGTKEIYEHAARQLLNGQWTSKLGLEDDIRHPNLQALSAGSYGQVVTIIGRDYPDGPVLGDS